jgi:hypothetical protein
MNNPEDALWRTLLESTRRVQMNPATASIVINMLKIQNIEQFISRTTEAQAKGISDSIKNAARALPDTTRVPGITIQLTIPEQAALDADQRNVIIDAALQRAAEATETRQQEATAAAMTNVPYVSPESATMYHATWYWATLQQRMGLPLTANNTTCSPAALKETAARLQYEEKIATDLINVKPPGVLKNLNKFRDWWETWSMYMRSKRGAARIPLVYVFREHTAVTDDIRDKTYETTDEKYINCFTLDGTYFEVDNKTVFHELNIVLIGGPLESIAKKYEKREDGRAAVLAILAYANGDDAKMARTNEALKLIEATTYHRRSQNFTLDDFFSRLRKNYEILESNGEGLQESMKVSQMMGKINDPQLAIAKSVVMTQVKSDSTFEEVVTLLKSAMSASQTAMAHINPRQVSDLHKEGGGGPAPTSAATKTISDDKVTAKTYSPSEWKKLTFKQQQMVRNERKKASDKKRKQKEREAAAAEKKQSDSDEPSNDAGTQFGRGGSSSKKSKT